MTSMAGRRDAFSGGKIGLRCPSLLGDPAVGPWSAQRASSMTVLKEGKRARRIVAVAQVSFIRGGSWPRARPPSREPTGGSDAIHSGPPAAAVSHSRFLPPGSQRAIAVGGPGGARGSCGLRGLAELRLDGAPSDRGSFGGRSGHCACGSGVVYRFGWRSQSVQ